MNAYSSTDICVDFTDEEKEVLNKAVDILNNLESALEREDGAKDYADQVGWVACSIRDVLKGNFD